MRTADKHTLDLAVHGHALSLTVTNDPAGWRQLATVPRKAQVSRVGLEATGGYERSVTEYLRHEGFEVRLLQPLQTKAFAVCTCAAPRTTASMPA